MRSPRGRRGFARVVRPGFTLIETLVVAAIGSILLAILIPVLGSARSSAKSLVCSSNMRSAVIQFVEFAAGESRDGRGDSDQLGKYRFHINDAQEQLYGLDEFWNVPGATAEIKTGSELMLCPAGKGNLTKRRGLPCSSAALSPPENVSIAFNMRLYRAAVSFRGRNMLAPAATTTVHRGIVNRPYVPVLMDVDGEEAGRRSLDPFYTAPPIDDDDAYADGRHWMPSSRHGKKTNVAFMGGHVLRSATPADEHWDWSYQADAGR